MRVLIALDATPLSGEVVREAASRPWPVNSRFLLVHALDPFPFTKAPILLERAKQQTRAELERAAEQLRKGDWKTETEVVLGRAREVITKHAAAWKADMIVVGSNGGGAWQRAFLGSTARSVLRHATCSVEIVRPSLDSGKMAGLRPARILVASDGSEFSEAAIRSVAKRAWPKGSAAKVLSVPEPFMPISQFPYFDLNEIDQLNTAALKAAKKHADAGAETLFRADLEAASETPFPEQSTAREILKEAERWHADLLVVGSHGRRGFDRLFLGSVSEEIALHAQCSVEVIRSHSDSKTAKKGLKKGQNK